MLGNKVLATQENPSESAPPRATAARFGAAGGLFAPRWVTFALAGGLVVVGGITFLCAWLVQGQVMEEALEEQGRSFEGAWAGIVDDIAQDELAADGNGVAGFGDRIAAAAAAFPPVLDVVVFDPDRRLVTRWSRFGGEMPCSALVPLDRFLAGVHPAGTFGPNPVGCQVHPVNRGGALRASVVFHLDRDWLAGGVRAGRGVRRIAWHLAPVFLLSYVLLAVLLLGATRAARRWRARAAQVERIEALGAVADGINHEIRNPLNAVGLSLQLLERKHPDDETRTVVDTARREADRIRCALDEFARFTRLGRLQRARFEAGDALRRRGEAHDAPVDVEGRVELFWDRDKLADAFDLVVDFLVRHGPEGARVRVEVGRDGDDWRFQADGDAPAVDGDAVARLFDPYVRARPRDVGRGLALARAVFQAHGGDLAAKRKGSTLTLRGWGPTEPPGERPA